MNTNWIVTIAMARKDTTGAVRREALNNALQHVGHAVWQHLPGTDLLASWTGYQMWMTPSTAALCHTASLPV